MTNLCIPHAQDLVRGGDGCTVCRLERELAEAKRCGLAQGAEVQALQDGKANLMRELAEAQEELAQWRATGESVTRNEHDLSARLAEAESRLNLAQAEVTMLRHFNAEAEALLRVMPGYGLSAYDKERWEKARNAFLAPDSAPAVLHNRRWSDGEPEITTHASEKDKEVARMIRDHQKIIDAKRKSCPKCHGAGAIDAPTSADDPSCPKCDGEGVRQ